MVAQLIGTVGGEKVVGARNIWQSVGFSGDASTQDVREIPECKVDWTGLA